MTPSKIRPAPVLHDVAAAGPQPRRHRHDGTKNLATKNFAMPKAARLSAALLRRPRFDQVGALLATRLDHSVTTDR
jgi:hypothetical protein